MCVCGGGGGGGGGRGGTKAKALQACLISSDRVVRAGSKRSKGDRLSLPQETGRVRSSRYIIPLKVKRVCRLDQNTGFASPIELLSSKSFLFAITLTHALRLLY